MNKNTLKKYSYLKLNLAQSTKQERFGNGLYSYHFIANCFAFYVTFRREDYFPPPPLPPAPQETLHSFSTDLIPLKGLSLPVFQNLFTSIVSPELPLKITEAKKGFSQQELQQFKE